MMEFTYDGFVRWGFGFHNPNHAAAAICALLPFVWGFVRAEARLSRWVAAVRGLVTVALFVALALTYSRTGFAVAALEALAWAWLTGGRAGARPSQTRPRQARHFRWELCVVLGLLVVVAVAGGVAGRFTPDAAALNRPKIWWAGLKLAAANPWGVGHGHSGLLASTFLLDGIEIRTLVNSHLTLLAEYGWIAGCVWFAFVVAALGRARHVHPSLWVAFAGLTVSACMASVFDWQVLLDWSEMGDLGGVNFTLSWILFAAYLVMGMLLVVMKRRERRFPEERLLPGKRHFYRFTLGGILRAACPAACGACVLLALLLFVPTADVPKVQHGFVVKDGAEMPLVLHDAEWSLAAVLPYLETDGYRLAIEPGYQPCAEPLKSVWLFGTCAESTHRFTDAAVTVVSPPEFCIFPQNVQIIR